MANNESGIAITVNNWKKFVGVVKALNQSYNPVNPLLKLQSLNAITVAADTVTTAWKKAEVVIDNAVDERITLFRDLKPFSTQICSIFSTSGVDKQYADAAETLHKKIQGSRATSGRKPPAVKPGEDQPKPDPKKISASQTSFVQLAEHLDKLIELISSHQQYAPNEQELTVASLKTYHAKLVASNEKVDTANTAYKNSIITRNAVFNQPITGMVDVSKEVKKYVQGVFKASSPTFREINSINFKKIKE